MCGRFSLTTPQEIIFNYFNIDPFTELTPRYNIAPSQNVLIIRENDEGKREGALVRWGLIPSWMKSDDINSSLINARVETAYEKPSFRHAFKKRRCLVVSDGFYEWQIVEGSKTKQPYYMTKPKHEVFALAGLWEQWHGGQDRVIESCALLTTEANPQMQQVHSRMPIILSKNDYDQWIHHDEEVEKIQTFIRGVSNPELCLTPVSTVVNNARFDGPECIK